MNNPSRSLQFAVWGGLAVVIFVIAGAFVSSKLRSEKPVVSAPPVFGQVADFSLTNQNAEVVSLAALRGHVWVADIIFTRCAGPCPRMTGQMKELQIALPTTSAAKLVTLTTDPEFDTPPILKKYGEHYAADLSRWNFFTGTKKEIAALAIDSLKLTAVEKKPEQRADDADLFIHSTIFVVVDKQARLRGVFQTGGEDVDWNKAKADILALVAQLELEP